MAGSAHLTSYEARRGQLLDYFDTTATEAWARLTSEAPVGRIRATVRAGRARMRDILLNELPADLTGARVLDAGCGTGALAVEAARRGAVVTAVDLSPRLIHLAAERLPRDLGRGSITFIAGDMLDDPQGRFDHVVAMDSLIHYRAPDMVRALETLARRCEGSIVFTFAPRTPALTVMHGLGRLFPRGDRAPAIEPVAAGRLRRLMRLEPGLSGWRCGESRRVASGFYIAESMGMCRA